MGEPNNLSDTYLHGDAERAARIGRSYRGPKRVAFVVNTDRWFLSHRATWGVALRAAGASVTVIAEDTGESDSIRKLGFEFVTVSVGRESSGVFAMARSASLIFAHLLRLRPDLVFLTAQAAYTLGWPAAVVLRRTNFIRVVSGLGRALDAGVLTSRASRVVQLAGQLSGRLTNVYTLFQVEHDRETFSRLGLLPAPSRSIVIPGTGIDTQSWKGCARSRNFEAPVILFASRLFREKGIFEFVEAARKLRGTGWRFQVAGEPDRGVDSAVTTAELEEWRSEGAVELLGHRKNLSEVLAKATLFVLPTRHPEGTPKVLIEAGASGLPSVVSGHPGCAAVVEHGVTGIVLSPNPTVPELTTAIEEMASDSSRAAAMGAAASCRIDARFSLEAVLARLLTWRPVGAVAAS